MQPRLAFIGTGWIGRSRLKAVVDAGVATVSAIYEPDAKSGEAALAVAPAAELTPNFDVLLASAPDGVVIATPSALHAQQAIAALHAGCAVFCQKPLARNAAEARAVVDAAQSADRLLGLDLSYRHTRAMQEVSSRILSGAIGEVHAVDLTFHNAYGPDKPWFYDRRLSGGGCIADLGIHLVDLLMWCLDFPSVRSVQANLFSQGRDLKRDGTEVEDLAFATLELEGGRVARLACSWNLHAGKEAEIAAVFHGKTGSLQFRNIAGSFYDFEARYCHRTQAETIIAPPDEWAGGAIVQWAKRLARDPTFDVQAEEYVRVAQVVDHVYGAGQRGQPARILV